MTYDQQKGRMRTSPVQLAAFRVSAVSGGWMTGRPRASLPPQAGVIGE